MKKLLIFLLFFATKLVAQVSSYTFSQSNGTYTPITGGKVYGTFNSTFETFVDVNNPSGICNGFSYYCGLNGTGIPIGFDFLFNNRVFDKMGVSYNGVISLGSSSFSPAVDAYVWDLADGIPSGGAHLRNRIAGLLKENVANPNSELRVETIGTAPNRICIIQWANVHEYNLSGDNLNFQIQLFETTNQVKVVYGSCVGIAANTAAVVGLGGESPTDFNNRKGTGSWATTMAGTSNADMVNFNNINVPASGLTFTWTPPTIACKPPASLNITSVAVPNASFSWVAAPGASSYEYAFTTSQVPPTSGTNTSALSASVSSAAANTVLYAHVRSNCGGSFSAWKSTVYVPCVNLVSPANGFTGMAYAGVSSAFNIVPQFSWASISGISSYYFVYSSTNWATADSVFTSNSSNFTLFENQFKKGLTYKWYIKPNYGAYNSTGCLTSNSFTFTTLPGPPDCSQLISPGNGATNVSLTPTLTWNAPTSGPAPTGYKLYVDERLNFGSSPIQINAPNTSFSFINSQFLYDQPVYWKIRPENIENQASGNAGCEANIFSFKNPPLTCGQTYYDTGGPAGNYSYTDSTVTTIYPTIATEKVKVNFTSFDMDSSAGLDTLYVYDGPNISSPSLGKFYYFNSPGSFTSSHSNGALTFRFLAGGGNTFNGWVAPVTCVAAPTCYMPRTTSLTNISSTAAQLNWTASGVPPGIGYEIFVTTSVIPNASTIPTYTTTSLSRVLTSLTPSTTYAIYVRSNCDNVNKSDWKYIRLITLPTPQANDQPAGASTLTVASSVCDLNTAPTYDIYGATNTNIVANPSCGKPSVKDLWFKITMPASGAAVFKMSPYRSATQYSNKLGMAIYSDTYFNYLCSTKADVNLSLNGFSGGTVMYIRVWDEEEAGSSPIKICVYDPGAAPNCATITSPANGATNVAINSAINWTAPVGGTTPLNYKVLLSTSNPPTTTLAYLDATSTTFTPNSLLPNTTYYLKIIPTNYGGDAGGCCASCPMVSFTNTNPVCTANFYDPGGVSGNYTAAAPVTTVFTPTAPNLKVKVTFNSFDLDKFSSLKMYNGPNASSELIGIYTKYNLPTSYTATGSTGQLTFVFSNNNQSSSGPGWDASISLCEPAGEGLLPTSLNSISAGPTTSTTANLFWSNCDASRGSELYYSTSATTPLPSTMPSFFVGSSILLKNLTPNTHYYVWVRCILVNGQKGGWRALPDGFYTKVPNDLPADATTLSNTCTGAPYNISNSSHNNREVVAGCDYYVGIGGGGANLGTSKSMWFKFVAPPSGSVKISTDYAGGTLPYTRLGLFTATDVNDFSTFTNIACADSNGVNIGMSNLYSAGLTAGNTYYVIVEQGSVYDEGSFCITMQELTTAMLASSGSCTVGKTIFPTNPNYRGWLSMTDLTGKLILNLKQTSGSAIGYMPSLNISASARNDGSSTPYGNRNYFINGNGVNAANIQLFMLDAEYANLGATLSELSVRNTYATICNPNYTSGGTLLNQTSATSQNGITVLNSSVNSLSNFYIQKGGVIINIFESITTGNWNVGSTWIAPSNTLLPTATKTVKINASHIVSVPNAVNEVKTIQMNGGTINLNGGNLEIKN
jgi:Bacterial Ig-like domain